MTQTATAERIRDYLERTVSWDNNHGDMEGYDEAAQKIAAEIDALTRERDDVRDAYAAQGAILSAARMEIESLKVNVIGWQAKAGDAGNKLVRAEQDVERLKRERDEARAIAKKCEDRFFAAASQAAGALAEVERQKTMLLRSARLVGEASGERILVDEAVAALQAEVERLRPAAEVGEKWLAYCDVWDRTHDNTASCDAWVAFREATTRARAAKGAALAHEAALKAQHVRGDA